jgi:hypothetical protein
VLHVVYLLTFATGAFYAGIARLDVFKRRLRHHWQNATRDASTLKAPSELFVRHHGQPVLEDLRIVDDRVVALLTEVAWTSELAARGVEVW